MYQKACLFILSLATLLAAQEPVTETIEGFLFIHSGPNEAAPKETYAIRGLKTANSLLKLRMGLDPTTSDDYTELLEENKRLKAPGNATYFKQLLAPDIAAANVFWHNAVQSSTPDSHVSADARGLAFLPNLTALGFAAWSQSPLADKANNDANGEHYFKEAIKTPSGALAADILEGWGGVTTLFEIPDYSNPPNRTRYPFLNPLPEFPAVFQAAGAKVLEDGSPEAEFGVLHISVRDVNGTDYGSAIPGIEILSTVWYGDGANDTFLEAERQHMVTEIVNLSIQAQKDIVSGAFVVPTI